MSLGVPIDYSRTAVGYETLPSAFTLLDRGARFWHDQDIRGGSEGNKTCTNLARSITFPIIICLSPVSMTADVVIGVGEIVFAYLKGYDWSIIESIARKKLLASPIQHLTFIVINSVGCVVSAIVLWCWLDGQVPLLILLPFSGGLCSIQSYPLSQMAVGRLPAWAKPDDFNIFLDGGAKNPSGIPYTEYFDKKYEEYRRNNLRFEANNNDFSQHFEQAGGRSRKESPELTQFQATRKQALPQLDKEGGSPPYVLFRQGLIDNKSPIELLGLNPNFTEGDLKRTKKLTVYFHPDKVQDRPKDEVDAMFKCYFAAYDCAKKDWETRGSPA